MSKIKKKVFQKVMRAVPKRGLADAKLAMTSEEQGMLYPTQISKHRKKMIYFMPLARFDLQRPTMFQEVLRKNSPVDIPFQLKSGLQLIGGKPSWLAPYLFKKILRYLRPIWILDSLRAFTSRPGVSLFCYLMLPRQLLCLHFPSLFCSLKLPLKQYRRPNSPPASMHHLEGGHIFG